MFGLPPAILAGTKAATPFTFSGSWETGMEGWTSSSGTQERDSGSAARTGTYYIIFDGSGSMDYVVPENVAAGLQITALVWARTWGSTMRRIMYRIGSGSFVSLQTTTDDNPVYTQLSGSFSNPGSNDITIRIEAGAGEVAVDDWLISGAPL